MPAQELPGTTALVTGASRGFGRAITIALSKHGAHVVGVARDRARLEELYAQLGDTFTPVSADAADPVVAGPLLDKHRPRTLVLNAGAAPLPRPIHRRTRQTFSRNWGVEVQHVSNWTRESLLLPRQAANVVIAISSGAAVNGSPLSGGYAGGQGHHTVHRLLRRRRVGPERARHQVHLRAAAAHSETGLGAAGVAAYAARQDVGIPAFVDRLGPALTTEQGGTAIVDIVTGSADDRDASLLTATGLSPAVMPSSPFGGVPPLPGGPESLPGSPEQSNRVGPRLTEARRHRRRPRRHTLPPDARARRPPFGAHAQGPLALWPSEAGPVITRSTTRERERQCAS